MQLLENTTTGQLLEVLEDIVEKVEIKPDFSICHPDSIKTKRYNSPRVQTWGKLSSDSLVISDQSSLVISGNSGDNISSDFVIFPFNVLVIMHLFVSMNLLEVGLKKPNLNNCGMLGFAMAQPNLRYCL